MISGRAGRLASVRKLLKNATSFFTSSIFSACLLKICLRTNSGPWVERGEGQNRASSSLIPQTPSGRIITFPSYQSQMSSILEVDSWLHPLLPPISHTTLTSQTLNFLPLRGQSHLSLPSSWVLEVTNFSTSCSGSLRPIFWASSSDRDSRTLSSGVSFSSNVFCHSSTVVWEQRQTAGWRREPEASRNKQGGGDRALLQSRKGRKGNQRGLSQGTSPSP